MQTKLNLVGKKQEKDTQVCEKPLSINELFEEASKALKEKRGAKKDAKEKG